jgi:hypothetical protein
MKAGEVTMTVRITRPEVEALINERLDGAVKDVEDVILHALQAS